MSKKLFECAAEAKVTLIVQVKDNQRTLLQNCRDIASASKPLTVDQSRTRGRNRDERRTVSVFDLVNDLAGTPWQFYVTTVIQVEREVFTRSAATGLLGRTTESAFFICNAPTDAKRAAAAIRAHWGIENTSHYTRDVTLGEDSSRIRAPNLACSPACAASRSTSTKPTAPEP
ncbi:ISAs1 family transposase [Acidisoma silvae]|uniref:ISAs1 family transposase n=1 Tax=Acidisoma silvae TaxID=2802396 RepID=A0A963YV99_9PROT|nr:ISAs1 family transposase [Acidisoma silvae]MCB8877404.1 ISAs1 family transposase [Acidisoma silvae]